MVGGDAGLKVATTKPFSACSNTLATPNIFEINALTAAEYINAPIPWNIGDPWAPAMAPFRSTLL